MSVDDKADVQAEEKALIEKARKGDGKAFEKLVRIHHRAVYSMAYRFMGDHGGADDVTQDTFMKVHSALDSFRGESSFKSWILRIAGNTARNALRSAGAGRRQYVEIEDVDIASHNTGYNDMERGQTARILKEAILQLPEKQRRALELRIFEDLSFIEVAEIMESPFDTAKANFRHALMNLKKILSTMEGNQGLEIMRMSLESFSEDE
jgi:RNA polymerase sigma-70 factor, ECF subfamily